MRILIVSATNIECNFLEKHYKKIDATNELIGFEYQNTFIDLLVTGVGVPLTIYHLMKLLNRENYNLVLNIGIAGYYKNMEIGEVVSVIQDEFGDVGMETENGFSTLFNEGFNNKDSFPFNDGILNSNFDNSKYTSLSKIKTVKGLTVNKVNISNATINGLINKFNPDIETMEGAAVFLVCVGEQIPCMQIRAISNKVGVRDKKEWNIPLSINNLETAIVSFLKEYC